MDRVSPPQIFRDPLSHLLIKGTDDARQGNQINSRNFKVDAGTGKADARDDAILFKGADRCRCHHCRGRGK